MTARIADLCPTTQLGFTLDEQRRLYVQAVMRCRERAGRERVHQLRTLSRRLLASLELAEALGCAAGPKTSRRVKGALSALSELRDVDVQLKSLRAPEMSQAHAARLAGELRRRRRKLKRRSERELGRLRLRKVERRVARVARALSAQSHGSASELSLLVVRGELAARHRLLQQERAAALADPARIHQVRLALKRYRYALAAVETLLPAPGALAETLGLLQDRLGEAHDAAVLLETATQTAERSGSRDLEELVQALSWRRSRAEQVALDALLGAELAFPW